VGHDGRCSLGAKRHCWWQRSAPRQQWIADNLCSGETCVIEGSNHSTIFDNSEEHARAVGAFFRRHGGAG
jgi:hypothetical protein